MSGAPTIAYTSLAALLAALEIDSLTLDAVPRDERDAARVLGEHATLCDGAASAAVVVARSTHGETRAALDDAAALADRALVVVDADGRALVAAATWTAARPEWLLLDDPPPGVQVLLSTAALAGCPGLPGRWRGGPRASEAAAVAARATPPRSDRTMAADHERREADRLRAALVEQRAWVAAEAARARASATWRIGHRVVRTGRLLTLRRDRGTDALSRMVQRMQDPPQP